ncbi:GH36-type glycosyl hydrolase domain-containing protein [Rhodoferax sp. UBA5149]|uniref:GH36-type glycosyl hydrolase domain-containing protein n=1 Tax=Rhodoferax sp. UBA5149 TaxID=1947379 RepID=UPI0025CDD7F8|nr:glucoamylase family protein [Rhodoferax sp. UBA5149]
MSQSELLRLVPEAPQALQDILDSSRGAVQPPIRSEIFGLQRFAQHGRSLGETHRAARASSHAATFFPRLQSNIHTLREAHRYIAVQSSTGYDISPAAEWLLDNFHLIEAQLKEIHEGLPRSYFRTLPMLLDEPLAGLPRVYGVAWAFVAHTDGAFDEGLLMQFLSAYQESRELNLSEMWALPTTLRVVLIENLRRLAERVATNKAAREVANLCFDRIETYTVQALDQLLALLSQRGVGRVFLAQMAQRFQDRRATGETSEQTLFHDWLHNALPDMAAVQTQQSADRAADNLSVSNAVTSLRVIGDADWPEIVARTSALMRLMLTSAVFEAEHAGTRDQTLHGIELLARRSGRSEVLVAQTLLDLMRNTEGMNNATAVASYWLRGAGRPALMRALGLRPRLAFPWRAVSSRMVLPVYLSALLLGTLALVAWILVRHRAGLAGTDAPVWLTLLGAALMMSPASEAVVAVINRLISESARPQHLPRLALANGIPPEHRVMVVIPGMLTSIASAYDLVHRLQLHYLANPERHAQFALLTDWADADTPHVASDDALLASARQQIRALNLRYPNEAEEPGAAPRFIVLHRERLFSETERRWIGWERKRGKLELLVAAVAEGASVAFLDLGAESRIGADIQYIVTLDSDTQLPPGRLRELVGVAAHPQNQPLLDVSGRRVVSGYGILQPRVATPLPASKDFTLYHWLFAGQCGIDPYSAATSEVYQDLFGEGTFTGKGLLNVRAMHAVLSERLPDGQVLSHDLLEGSMARCAAVTDITVIEDAPFHADVAASRVHRWTRGDWQLLPFLLSPVRYRLRIINRWKMFDNLRRSLVAPMSLALLLLALGGAVVSPWAALALVMAAFSAGPLMGAVAGFSPSRDDVAKLYFYRQAATDLARTVWGGLWHLGQLLQHTLMSVDAIVRALYRMTISRRHLLQWTTAATAQAQANTGFTALARQHWSLPVVALLLLVALHETWFGATTPYPFLTLGLCLFWAASPVWTWWVSRPCPAHKDAALPLQDQTYLEGIARDTWRFFERCVVAEDNHLPPDNLQTLPHDMVAHRTSPTNIGLYLLSVACARQFGWIGTQELLMRLEATLATLVTLQRHRGHFMNWYDTQTCAPLLPMYVSTVDSGNLSGHLLSVAQACLELARAPHDGDAAQRAILAARKRLAPLLPLWSDLLPTLLGDAALARLLALPDPLAECRHNAEQFERWLREAGDELATLLSDKAEPVAPAQPKPRDELAWRLVDYVATLRSAWLDVQAATRVDAAGVSDTHEAARRLQALADECEQLAWQADFSFLYHHKRHLLHIGFRVAEQELDAGFYDLLASESRLTSLLAVAKGDVPVSHWTSLGRLFYAVGAEAGLRSWSGSMFEYLMPSLVLDEPYGSVLRDAGRAAIREQIAFAQAQDVPWGISESAYAGSDHTLAYQYAPQGVPRLALRRTPLDELVIAPYATALAAQIAPHLAVGNFAALEKLAARARYGFIEALDFSPARQSGGEVFTPVSTFMSHHQGMSIVALANVLLGGPAQRWGMANAHVEAVTSLLHERAPREVSMLYAPAMGPPPQALQRRRTARLLREVLPGSTAVEPTHVLSNGRYTVSLRANGAGWSRWGQTSITRWRDDALRDAYGSFFYVRWDSQQRPVSLTQHPAPDPAADYQSTYHGDRVCFDATWPGLQTHVTVWVSPEDDIEFRQVELRNLSNRTLEIELISAFEVTLSDSLADEAHPAFTNLFVRAEWLATHQALLFERKPRLPTERGLQAAHFLAETDPYMVGMRLTTDRQRWRGRNHAVNQPLASFDPLPSESSDPAARLDTGLDPVCALAVQLRIAPNAKALLTFATAASDNGGTLRAVIDKYRQHSHVQRASLMSATLTGIRLRALRISGENFAAVQTLTTALVLSLTRPQSRAVRFENAAVEVCDRRLLWRFGISGDRPLILVSVGVLQGLGLLRSMAQALSLWAWGGIACDLVVVNAEPISYLMALHREIIALRERHVANSGAQGAPAVTGFHVLRADELSSEELSTLQAQARVRLNADGRPLAHHVQEWIELHEQAFEQRHDRSTSAVSVASGATAAVPAPVGEFAATSGEFRFQVSADLRPARPWINVLANPAFGAQLSEAGGGYTWAVNSRLNQLTAWSNDPVADPPSEWFLLQDRKTMEVWSVTPSAWGDDSVTYRVSHGQGYSVISHRRGDVEVTASWCVDAQTSVKQVQLRLVNRGHRTLNLRVIGVAEWMMGANRADRSTARTAMYSQRLPALQQSNLGLDVMRGQKLTALLCTQRERSAGYGDGTAFFGLASAEDEAEDWTCDRRECFDARGLLVLPDHFDRRSGDGLDPCAALSTRVALIAGESVERVFLLGYAENASAARQLATLAAATPAERRMGQVRSTWDQLLGAATVKTPDPLFDAMVNRWLLYQTVTCRLWAKAGFYQAGGATGFRDQLQDAMALAWAAPDMLRQQIVLGASRQFAEGDVQHWWHAPTGAGVRTHFSDDLLWLPHATMHYLRVTGDATLLDQSVPFIEGAAIPEGAEDAYYTPDVSAQQASVYEHSARAIDRSLRVGAHGLPLMGSGDWNDGMNRVGIEGRGESVWLGWFLCQLVADFAPLARERGDETRAQRWENAAQGWKVALNGPAWDGQWFKRAFFDDGQALGSQSNPEARIDLIAQAWAVLSRAAPPALQRMAMAAVEVHLVDHEAGLIRLLDPPLVNAVPSAGYIQAYPPGVRENGGQYSHAGVWALMAQCDLEKSLPGPRDIGDFAYRYFTYLSPAHRARHPTHGAVYGIEPYVMAGDVYTQPPYVGRGGWSWYTGAAAWMHRAAIESIFGLHQGAQELCFSPCLPSHWHRAELTLVRDGRTMRFIMHRAGAAAALAATAPWGAKLLRPGQPLRWPDLAPNSCFVIPLLDEAAPPSARQP